MGEANPSEDDETDHEFVVCASCGSKAAPTWSFCRSCQSSLDDALPPEGGLEKYGIADEFDMEERGCPKCGHEEADVDKVATTGQGPTALFDLQNRQFYAVSCANCGYTEFYRSGDGNVVIDLFLGG